VTILLEIMRDRFSVQLINLGRAIILMPKSSKFKAYIYLSAAH
jgi:hypothetical protein